VISEVLGVDVERRVEFKHWVDDLLSAGGRASFRRSGWRKSSAARATSARTSRRFDRRKEKPGDDLLSGFIHAEINGETLTRIEVLNLGICCCWAAVETTANLLAITCAQFRQYPKVLEAIRADPARPFVD